MSIQKRHSYGVIPIIKDGDSFQILLINQKDSKGDYWTFPKGTPEVGETALETAVRETAEEVGLVMDTLDPDFSCTEEYSFESRGARIKKQVTYYLGVPTSRQTTAQEAEVRECVDECRQGVHSLFTWLDGTQNVWVCSCKKERKCNANRHK